MNLPQGGVDLRAACQLTCVSDNNSVTTDYSQVECVFQSSVNPPHHCVAPGQLGLNAPAVVLTKIIIGIRACFDV